MAEPRFPMTLKSRLSLSDVMDPQRVQMLLEAHGAMLGRPITLLDAEDEPFSGPRPGALDGWLRHPVRAGGRRVGTLVAAPKGPEPPPPTGQDVLACLGSVLEDLAALRVQVLEEQAAHERADATLRASEDWVRALVEQMNEGLVAVDLDGRITYTNPFLDGLLDHPQGTLLGHPFTELLVEGDRTAFLEALARRREGRADQYELHLLHRDGHLLPCAVSGTPLRGADGTIKGAFGLFTDISERRRVLEALRRSEAAFRSVFENMQDVFYRSDREGRLVLVSPSGLRMLGYGSASELLGHSIADLWYLIPADRERFLEALSVKGYVTNYEVMLRKKDGTPVIVSTNSHFYYDDTGELLGVEGVFYDVTEQKQAEEALRRSEAAYRRLVNQVHDIIYAYKPDGTISFASEQVRLLGYTPEEVAARPLLDFVHPDDHAPALAMLLRVLKEHVPGRIECRLLRKDGAYEWCEEQSEPCLEGGRVTEVHGVIRIVTARREAEEALRRSEQRYRTLLETLGEGVAYVDLEETFLFVNPAAEAIFGMPPGTLVGMNLSDFTTPEEFRQIQFRTIQHHSGDRAPYELQIRRPDGELRTLLVTATPHPALEGTTPGVLGVFRDITEGRETEASLRRLSSAIAQASDAILIADTEGIIRYANPAAETLTGYAQGQLLGTGVRKLLGEDPDRRTHAEAWGSVLKGATWRGPLPIRSLDGTARQTLTSLSPVRNEGGAIAFVIIDSRDVTREQELEAQLRHSQRLEAIGVLAGGIAHDFNNILTPILGYAELAQLHLDKDLRTREYVAEILAAGRRAAGLVEQILTFSRRGEQDCHPVHVVSIVKEALKLLRAALPSTITIETDLCEEAGSVVADPSQLHQVVVNLCTNAFHAMRETGGTLRVHLVDICLPEPRSVQGTVLQDGTYVRMEIADTGCGMDAETQKKIFLPFFTTKEVGEGTGLGLSIVHGIVTGLGGAIDVESAPGCGSTFTLYLPAHGSEAREAPRKPSPLPSGQERILVVDDEVMVGAMLRDMLTELGYQVAVLDSAVDALQTLRMAPTHWDLVLSDMTMPEMTGLELAQQLKAHSIGTPVILLSGYSDGLNEAQVVDLGIVALLRKPVPLPALTHLIRKTLDQTRAEA